MISVAMTPKVFADKVAELKAEQGVCLVGSKGTLVHDGVDMDYEYDGEHLILSFPNVNSVKRAFIELKVHAWLSSGTNKVNTSASALIALALCCSMVFGLTGCTPKQQQDTKMVVSQIIQFEPELALAVDTLASTVATFLPQDALLIQSLQPIFDNAAAALKLTGDTYVATPNNGTLASFQSTLTTLLSTNADQFLAAARISNPTSQAQAKLAIGAVRTILLLMDGALQKTQTPAQTAAVAQARMLKLREVAPYLDHHKIEMATGHSFRTVYAYETSLGF